MKRLFTIFITLLILLSSGRSHAQGRRDLSPENIYRPIYGYVIDTCTNEPVPKVLVYGFDSLEDAERGREALAISKNPMTLKLKGDVVETRTDESGRYMIPALSKGVLLFHFKDRKETVVEEIAGRSSVSLGKKEKELTLMDLGIDLSKIMVPERRRSRDKEPAGITMDLDFNCYVPYLGEGSKDCRLMIQRRVTDLETGEIISSTIPVARDGKDYHREARKRIAEGVRDSVYLIADASQPLTSRSFDIRVQDHVETEPWKTRCFSLDYFVTLDMSGKVADLDTVHMYTNRVGRPLKYLGHDFEPYEMEEPQEYSANRRLVKRRLVLQGEYEGKIPDVLMDESYMLTELQVKAVAAPFGPYRECMALADTQVQRVMGEHRKVFAEKLTPMVRVIRTSEVVRWNDAAEALEKNGYVDLAQKVNDIVMKEADDVDLQSEKVASLEGYEEIIVPMLKDMARVEYRYVFTTDRQYYRADYIRLFRQADDDERLEYLCRRAIEESMVIDKEPWDYAANLLATRYIRSRRVDTELLAPLVSAPDRAAQEVIANHSIMLMMDGSYADAAALTENLPPKYSFIHEIAGCKAGGEPSGPDAMKMISSSSARNSAVMDMFTENIGDHTLEAIDSMEDSDAMKWYLRARCLGLMYENQEYRMKEERIGNGNVYDEVKASLKKCFAADDTLVRQAVMDADINEMALKEVLDVKVL